MKCYGALLGFNLPWQQLGSILQRLEGFAVTQFCCRFFFSSCTYVHTQSHTHLSEAALAMVFIHELYSNLIESPNGFYVGHFPLCVFVCVCVLCACVEGGLSAGQRGP